MTDELAKDKKAKNHSRLMIEMLSQIFIQTGGRTENPKIAEICAKIAIDFYNCFGPGGIREEYIQVDKPLELNKTYKTKMQTGEKFTITEIITSKPSEKIINVKGIYESSPHLESCPLDPERLIPETETVVKEIPICRYCLQDLP